ncbi:hypothetical protein NX059_007385 [Plenodomus lindquistii]|nr:hypothetical protein NX059_007385 [Plenodomus lindquistii]
MSNTKLPAEDTVTDTTVKIERNGINSPQAQDKFPSYDLSKRETLSHELQKAMQEVQKTASQDTINARTSVS